VAAVFTSADAAADAEMGAIDSPETSEAGARSREIPRRGVLYVNSKSRQGAEWYAQVRDALLAGGLELTESTAFRDPKQVAPAVQRSVESGAELVIVGGGDGTFSSVARYCASKETVLGVIPLGTGNAFARDLGIPVSVEGACEAILKGKVADIDMGLVGDRQFVNVVTVGLTTKIAQGLTGDAKKHLGKAVYVVSLLRALAAVKPFVAKLELPSGEHEFDSLQVVIGNGRFHAGPFPVAPDASITGGWLAIYALASRNKSDFLRMALHMAGGKHVELKEVKAFREKSGRLSTIPGRLVTVDGEVCEKTPVAFAIAPGALRVAVPQDFEELPPKRL
jgi:diacylglycerol kinase (ATP)